MNVAADCDALNVLLVHFGLRAMVSQLLMKCGGKILTLERVRRYEAQAALRGELDALVNANLCETCDHPDERDLEKKARKLWRQIDGLGQKHFRTTSANDRGLLFEAQNLEVPLVSCDGPLLKLAAERDQALLGVTVHGAG